MRVVAASGFRLSWSSCFNGTARLHDARHTAATALLILGVQRAVMGLMGWSSSGLAARYQRITGRIRGDVAERVGGPIWGSSAGEWDWN